MKKRKNKLAIIALSGLLAVGVVAGTYAFFTQSQQFANIFSTKPYSADIYEHFTPPTDWTPGTTTTKQIFATNNGQGDLVVRASYTESWKSANGAALPLTFGSPAASAATLNFATNSNWVQDGNFYYYQNILAPGATTTSLLDSVTFNPNVPNDAVAVDGSGKTYGQTGYDASAWSADGSTYLGYTGTDGNLHKTYKSTGNGYDGATYTLTFKVEVLQATKAAMTSVWGYDTTATSGGAYTLYNMLQS